MDSSYYPLIAAGVSAAAKSITAASQRKNAKDLKESKFIPQELLMNKDLAQLMAYSKEAPGQAKAEEMVRRGQANTLATIRRTAGGNTGKLASASIATQGATNDAIERLAAEGRRYADRNLDRVFSSNLAIADQKQRNRAEFNRAKIDLLAASDQNYMKGFNDLLEGAMATGYLKGGGSASLPPSRGAKGSGSAGPYFSQGNLDYSLVPSNLNPPY